MAYLIRKRNDLVLQYQRALNVLHFSRVALGNAGSLSELAGSQIVSLRQHSAAETSTRDCDGASPGEVHGGGGHII
jgi:hypothetical protein